MWIKYVLDGVGWATATLGDGRRQIDMTASYLHDSLGQLAETVLALSQGQTETAIIFMDEPGEHHLILHRDGSGMIVAQARWFQDWASWEVHPADQYEIAFEAESDWMTFRDSVVAALGSVLAEHGLAGYKEKWVEHDFPRETFEQLLRLGRIS